MVVKQYDFSGHRQLFILLKFFIAVIKNVVLAFNIT